MHQSHQQSFGEPNLVGGFVAWEMKLAMANTASENRVHCSKWFAFIGGAALQYSGHPPWAASGKFIIPFAGRLLRASEPLWRFYRVRTHPFTPEETSRCLY